MPPHLGLVCIPLADDIKYRTITRKRLLTHSPEGQQKLLDDIYRDNIQTLDKALRYCEREGIQLYRLTSSIFPFSDDDIGRDLPLTAGSRDADAGDGARAVVQKAVDADAPEESHVGKRAHAHVRGGHRDHVERLVDDHADRRAARVVDLPRARHVPRHRGWTRVGLGLAVLRRLVT